MGTQMDTNKNGILRERDTLLNQSMDDKRVKAKDGARRVGRPVRSGIQHGSPIGHPTEMMLGYEMIEQKIQSFMYKNPKKPETKKEHTVEELENFLVQIVKIASEQRGRGLRYLRRR